MPSFLNGDAGWCGAARDPPKIPCCGVLSLLVRNGAYDSKNGVVGDIEGVPESLQFLGGRCLEMRNAPDGVPPVGMVMKHLRQDALEQGPVRFIQVLTPFLLHYLAFGEITRFIDAKKHHAFGFEPEREFKLV